MMLVFVIGAVLNYTYNIAMGWLLSPDQYGILGIAISFLTILSLFVSAAFPLTVAKFLSEENDDHLKFRVFKSSLVGNFCIALIISFFFYALYASGVIRLDSTYKPFIILIVLALVFSSIGGVYTSALQGTFRFKKYGLVSTITIFAKLISAVLLVSLGLGAIGAFFGLIAGTTAGLILAVAFSADFKYWKSDGWADRRIYSFALPMFFGTFFMTLLMNLDILSVKFLSEKVLSDTLTGYYRSALILAELPVFIVGALMGAMFPYISKYSSINNGYSNKTLKYTVLMICPISITLFVIPSSILALVFPLSYAAASHALGVLSLGMGFFVVITALASIFQAMHRPRVPAIMLMLSIIVDLTALIFLVPRYGILGAATSTTIACIIGLLGLAGIYFKLGYIKLDYINAVRTFMSFILFGTLVLIFPHETKILTLFDLVLSSVLYMVVLFVFGLLKDEDIQMILSGFNFSDKKLIERITAHVKSLNLLFRG
jgi:O-antigen/teichoic acid export membrane protein